MELIQNYKAIAEQVSFELIDIRERLHCTSDLVLALLQTLISQGVVTPEQLEEREKNWWKENARHQ
jgi:hypothetical protein